MTAACPIANFAFVDNVVWRGERPRTYAAAQWIVHAGARSIINLEWEASDRDVFRGMLPYANQYRARDFEPLPWLAPSMEDWHIRRFLTILRVAPHPTLVHCRSGQNRTGVAVAAHRLLNRGDLLGAVLDEFNSYRGWWARRDARYIRSLYERRREFRASAALPPSNEML